jgi:nucleotide-binding universal stress UspA family protein
VSEKCPVCRSVEEDGRRHLDALMYEQVPSAAAEENYLLTLVRFIDDPQFARAYARSAGVCLPHLLDAAARSAGARGLSQLVSRTLAKWEELRGDLDRFVSKHDYRNREPFTDAEASSYRRAFEVLAGRGKLELRVKELTAPLNETTVIRQGHEVETIVTMAKDGKFDLLVIGYHGHSGIFGRSHLGSTAQSIVRLAPCPVLLAK